MELKEANKIIAEFMGMGISGPEFGVCEGFFIIEKGSTNGRFEGVAYSESLNALVPVWEKLKMFRVTLEYFDREEKSADMDLSHNHTAYGKTIQEAACISTALKILDLELEDLE